MLLTTYIMLFACMMLIYFWSLTFASACSFYALSWGYFHIVCLFKMLFCIIYSSLNQLFF